MTGRYKSFLAALFIPALILLPGSQALAMEQMNHSHETTPDELKPATDQVVRSSFEKKGVRVDFSVTPLTEEGESPHPLREAELAEVAFKISDAATGAPISPLEPAVWVNLDKESVLAEDLSCQEKIGLYLQGTLSFQADIDLNKFYMLVMNNDHTISVVDPILGVNGITQLYGLILLKERGEDWVMDKEEKHLYVSMPKSGMVAVVDLESFKVIRNIEAGSSPAKLSLQPDGHYLWVGNSGEKPEENGVSVIDTRSQERVGFIATGAGYHEFAHSDDSLTTYVTSSDANELLLIDTAQLEIAKRIPVGTRPISLAYSSLSQAAYVASEGSGTITVIDNARRAVSSTIDTSPGLIALRFAPGGRWGFAANLKRDRVYVIDASGNRLSHEFAVSKQPHQVSFTANYAYIRSLGASEMQLIPLAELSRKADFEIQTVPLGVRPPNEYSHPAIANAISATGEWDTVLVASPADKTVYYYMEGMVAPMGTFPTYGRVPRAVRVIDRSLRETEPGTYSAKLRVPRSGNYEVAFLIDSPWVYNCFSFDAAVNPVLEAARAKAPPKLDILNRERDLTVGEVYRLQFTLSRANQGEQLRDLGDISILTSRPPGNWQSRLQANPKQDGSYEVALKVDQPGVYYLYFAVPSLKIDYASLPYLVLNASAKKGG